VVSLSGRADAAARKRLRAALASHTRWAPGYLLVDLSGLGVLEMAALRELVRARYVIYGMGGVLALISPRPEVERLLRLSGADQLMPLYTSTEEAMAG
jgi:anti-anti-sigma factor